MRSIGRWSYGIYLWEIPVLLLIAYWWPPGVTGILLAGRVGFMVVAVAIAAVSFAIYETPIRHSPRLTGNPTLSLLCALAFILVSLAMITVIARW